MEVNTPGVIAGHKTIFQQPEDSSDGEIEAVVIDDYGAGRHGTLAEPQIKDNVFKENEYDDKE